MASSAGRIAVLSLLVAGSYVPIGGLRTRSLIFGNTNVDVTTADSAGRWREMLGGAGIQNIDIDAAGLYQNDAAAVTMFQALQNSTLQAIKFYIPSIIAITGNFFIYSGQLDSPYSEGMAFQFKALSSGQPTITYGQP